MPSIHRSANVPFTAEQMYTLVNDIESYPRFLHWCRGAQITQRGEHSVDATLDIGLAGLHKRFSTRNTLDPPRRIGVDLLNGPFRHLQGEWRFEPRTEGCAITLELVFETKPSPFAFIFAAAFEEIARSQMQAFLARAETLYG